MPRRALTGCVHAEEGVGLLPGRAGADAPGVVLPSVDLRDQDFPARVATAIRSLHGFRDDQSLLITRPDSAPVGTERSVET